MQLFWWDIEMKRKENHFSSQLQRQENYSENAWLTWPKRTQTRGHIHKSNITNTYDISIHTICSEYCFVYHSPSPSLYKRTNQKFVLVSCSCPYTHANRGTTPHCFGYVIVQDNHNIVSSSERVDVCEKCIHCSLSDELWIGCYHSCVVQNWVGVYKLKREPIYE